MIATVNLPANFAAALNAGRLATLADARVNDAFDQFARGLARVCCGRLKDARIDFEAAREDVGEPAVLEIALLDIQVPGKAIEVQQTIEQLAMNLPANSLLIARAKHILGLARNKLGNLQGARAALLEALSLFQKLDSELGEAQVRDSLGSVLADCGRLDDAAHHFSMSIAMKALHQDVDGLAISLGNLGRVQLRAGRVESASECFEADLKLIMGRASDRTRARVLNDLGRARLAAGAIDDAITRLEQSLAIAQARGYADVSCFVLKDLTLAFVAKGDLDSAANSSQLAAESLPPSAESYLWAYWQIAQGTLLAAQKKREAIELFREACDQFKAIPFVEGELEALIGLAKATLAFGDAKATEQHVLRGLTLARSTSYQRFIPELNKLLFESTSSRENTDVGTIENALGDIGSRFITLGRLGGGAFGEVFRVYDISRQFESALKVIRLSDIYDELLRERLKTSVQREIQVGLSVQHPGVARIFEVGNLANDDCFVLQELVEGTPLDSLMRGNKGDLRQGLKLIANIAFALDALHTRGVVHCDIKPANIILRPNGMPVLIDFGVAQVTNHRATDTTSILGSIPYMSPEQAAKRGVDAKSDVYSLGVLAFEWFAGERPLSVRGESEQEIARLIESTPPLPLSRVRPDAPKELESLIASALVKSPKQRPASTRAFAESLQAIQERL